MKIEKLKELEKIVKKADYGTEYRSLNYVLYYSSFIGNALSIFFAYFFIFKLLKESVTVIQNDIFFGSFAVMVLCVLEYIKRDIFDKFSTEFLRYKNIIAKEVLGLAIGTCFVVMFSFYCSLTGAHEFSSKKDVIEQTTTATTDTLTNTLKAEYAKKIDPLIKRNDDLFVENQKKESRKDLAPSQSAIRRIEIEIDKNRTEITQNKEEIKNLEAELNSKISEKSKTLTDKASEDKTKNESNSTKFVWFSTIFELLIMIGIYYNKFYKFKSHADYTDKINTNDKYRLWYLYHNFIDFITRQSNKGEVVYNPIELVKVAEMNGIVVSLEETTNFLELTVQLKICRKVGDKYMLCLDPKDAVEKMKKNFDIE